MNEILSYGHINRSRSLNPIDILIWSRCVSYLFTGNVRDDPLDFCKLDFLFSRYQFLHFSCKSATNFSRENFAKGQDYFNSQGACATILMILSSIAEDLEKIQKIASCVATLFMWYDLSYLAKQTEILLHQWHYHFGVDITVLSSPLYLKK